MGLGTATFGGLYTSVSQEECDAAINCALDNGITYIDTAPHYGKGTAERRLAKSLKGKPRASFEISTKIGRLLVPTEYEAEPDFADTDTSVTRVFDFSESGVEKSLRSSLERMELESVEILMIHDPDDNADAAIRESFPALLKMRDKGIIKAIGVGMNQSYLSYQTEINANLYMEYRQMYFPLHSPLECPLYKDIITLSLICVIGQQEMDYTSQSQADV
jgi:D-threo-aldose 1-dehydrogenase